MSHVEEHALAGVPRPSESPQPLVREAELAHVLRGLIAAFVEAVDWVRRNPCLLRKVLRDPVLDSLHDFRCGQVYRGGESA